MLIKALTRSLALAGFLFSTSSIADSGAPFLWTIQGAKTQHYLLGSVHLLPENAHPLPAALSRAYEASHTLVLETDLAEIGSSATQRKWRSAGHASRGIEKEISPDLLRQLQNKGKALNLPVSRCNTYKAWFCAITLELTALEKAGIKYGLGVDQYYFQRAKKDRKSTRWLESPDEQLALFSSMPANISAALLKSTLDDLGESGRSAEDLIQFWLAADTASFEHFVVEAEKRHPDLYDRILTKRNQSWLPKLLHLIEDDEPLLIIVGAAHLVGPMGIPTLMRNQGIDIEQVDSGETRFGHTQSTPIQ